MERNIQKKKLSDQVYQNLKRDLIIGVYKPGEVILQSELADMYKIGVTPLREALQRLASIHLINNISGMGFVVAPITLSEIQDLCEIRLILEENACRLATQRASDEELETIVQLASFTYHFKDPASYFEFVEANRHFHCFIASVSKNQSLFDFLSKTIDRMNRVILLALDLKDIAADAFDEHIALANAMKDKNLELVEKIAIGQNERTRDRVFEAITNQLRSDKRQMLNQIQIG